MAGSTNHKTCIMNRKHKPTPTQTTNPTAANPLPKKEQLKHSLMDHYDLEEMFGVSRGTIYNWCRKGLLKYIQMGGKRYFNTEELDAMIKERKQLMVPGEGKKKK
jgi:excisionase family DNA binding protein